eukprot:scaffold1702_cov253-Pinguiococcus_pyrenoidosus.AAC.3
MGVWSSPCAQGRATSAATTMSPTLEDRQEGEGDPPELRNKPVRESNDMKYLECPAMKDSGGDPERCLHRAPSATPRSGLLRHRRRRSSPSPCELYESRCAVARRIPGAGQWGDIPSPPHPSPETALARPCPSRQRHC